MGVVMYFSMIRPQKKQQTKRQEMFNQMKKGDHVVTIGGLHGVIDAIDNDAKTVVIDSDGIYLTFNLAAIRDIQPSGVAAQAPAPAAAEAQKAVATEAKTDTADEATAKTDDDSEKTSEDSQTDDKESK